MQSNSIEYVPKIEPDSLEVLSLIYTPGVGQACLKIKENDGLSYMYTNRENSIAVLSFDYEKSLKRAVFLKNTLNIDAYPFELSQNCNQGSSESLAPWGRCPGNDSSSIKLIVENIYPNFCGIDLTLMSEEVENITFNVEIPILKKSGVDINDFFHPFSKNIFMFDIEKLEGDLEEKALHLREKAGGVLESQISTEKHQKPVAILSDGSAVLGFGNIGPEAGLPVMEGKAVLFKALGGVNAIPLCLKTQKTEEIIKIAYILQNSFSGINLEDISAPRCFDIEDELIETLGIPVFHDDQHGTAIVVLAALLNALNVADKKLDEVKILISGAGAAAQAVSKLILKAGATNIIHTDKNGIVSKNRDVNDSYLEKLAEITNKENLTGMLEDAIKGADVFIGLSAAGILKPELVKTMNEKPIIFALANPTPEIMPDIAQKAGAFIIATGRSDFPNQINNSIAFPGLFRGILDHDIKKITDDIKLECALGIASMIKEKDLTTTNILPNALDASVVGVIANRLSKF